MCEHWIERASARNHEHPSIMKRDLDGLKASWWACETTATRCSSSNERGFVTARSVKRLRGGSRYNKDLLAECSARPWDRLVWSDPRAVSIAISVIAPVPPEKAVRDIRKRLFINKSDLTTHGYTEGCPGCKGASVDAPPRNHSEACRERLTTQITTSSEDGMQRASESCACGTNGCGGRSNGCCRRLNRHDGGGLGTTSLTTRRRAPEQPLDCWVQGRLTWSLSLNRPVPGLCGLSAGIADVQKGWTFHDVQDCSAREQLEQLEPHLLLASSITTADAMRTTTGCGCEVTSVGFDSFSPIEIVTFPLKNGDSQIGC